MGESNVLLQIGQELYIKFQEWRRHSFGPTEISWLENRFCNLATQANRYEVKNGNDPTPGNITEEKESELEEFIDYAKVIMETLGHKVFEPLNRVTLEKGKEIYETTEDGRLLHLKRTIKKCM